MLLSDPKMKLFGKTIELPDGTRGPQSFEEEEEESYCSFQDPPNNHSSMLQIQNTNINGDAEDQHSHSDQSSGVKQTDTIEEDQVQPLTSEDLKESNVTPAIEEGSKADSTDNAAGIMKASKSEEDQSEADHSQEKTLKKPDKILPCPRCNSMETKFCYFNNYNVNQPRHFCKKCQRYWTAGGTMRSVPVGAGRRKNKNTPQFRHLTTPESVQSARVDHPKGVLNSNGTVLTFSSDTPLCESIASVLNIADKTIPRNGYSQPGDQGNSVSYGSKEIGDDGSSGSSVTAASIKDEVASCHPFPPQVPFFPGGPWAYPWIAPPTFGPASFPSPYFSTGPPYWACAVPGTWNIPWVIPSMPTALSSHTTPFLGSNSPPTLGKHSRDDNDMKLDDRKDEEAQEENNSEKCLWVPKTLRIDDPEEAAKSSIWATLGIKNDRVDSIGGGGLFKAFQGQSKDGGKTHVPETSTVLQANPAALSRSLNFHESS